MQEQEFKGLLKKETYLSLLKANWDKAFVQINYYYSNADLQKNHKDIHLWVRCKEKSMILQIKVIKQSSEKIRISDEYEMNISEVRTVITQEQLQKAWKDYNYGDVILLGFLATERSIRKVNDIEIALDRNSYNGFVDYEIEFEFKSEEVISLIEEMGIKDALQTSNGKYERFLSTLRDFC